eukprot:5573019-Prymnesium_polylepis.1
MGACMYPIRLRFESSQRTQGITSTRMPANIGTSICRNIMNTLACVGICAMPMDGVPSSTCPSVHAHRVYTESRVGSRTPHAVRESAFRQTRVRDPG